MKAKRKQLIVRSWDEQKETHEIKIPGKESIRLYIGRKYGENSREQNPVVCEILSVGAEIDTVSVGDLLVVHHNILTNEAIIIEHNVLDQYTLLAIHFDSTVYAKINQENGELIPLNGNCIAKRIKKEIKSTLHIPFEKTNDNEFDIVAAPEESDVKPGDRVLCYKYSDYEVVYHFNNEEKRAIRIWKEDILGVFNEVC